MSTRIRRLLAASGFGQGASGVQRAQRAQGRGVLGDRLPVLRERAARSRRRGKERQLWRRRGLDTERVCPFERAEVRIGDIAHCAGSSERVMQLAAGAAPAQRCQRCHALCYERPSSSTPGPCCVSIFVDHGDHDGWAV